MTFREKYIEAGFFAGYIDGTGMSRTELRDRPRMGRPETAAFQSATLCVAVFDSEHPRGRTVAQKGDRSLDCRSH